MAHVQSVTSMMLDRSLLDRSLECAVHALLVLMTYAKRCIDDHCVCPASLTHNTSLVNGALCSLQRPSQTQVKVAPPLAKSKSHFGHLARCARGTYPIDPSRLAPRQRTSSLSMPLTTLQATDSGLPWRNTKTGVGHGRAPTAYLSVNQLVHTSMAPVTASQLSGVPHMAPVNMPAQLSAVSLLSVSASVCTLAPFTLD